METGCPDSFQDSYLAMSLSQPSQATQEGPPPGRSRDTQATRPDASRGRGSAPWGSNAHVPPLRLPSLPPSVSAGSAGRGGRFDRVKTFERAYQREGGTFEPLAAFGGAESRQ